MDFPKISSSFPSPSSENFHRLAQLFPSAIKDGQVDFHALKAELGLFEEIDKEHYELTWAGKQQSMRVAGEAIRGRTLRYVPEDSKNPDTTENLYIEGDNLEVLKLLQNGYRGKIKMIYIDPPYNTGNDFVYRDNFAVPAMESDQAEGLMNGEEERLVANPKTSARYHATWLSMVYPRLRLARDLLSNDGVIFISIDDNEAGNLREICDEVFGEDNFVACIIWERAFSPINLKRHFSENHDYILCFAKQLGYLTCNGLTRDAKADARYKNIDNDPRGPWTSGDLSVGPAVQDKIYEIITPSGRSVYPPTGYCWRLTKERFNEYLGENRIWFGENGDTVPRIKRYLSEVKQVITPLTIWTYSEVGHSQEAQQRLKELFNNNAYFEYPKPVNLIERMISLYSKSDSIILDFFSGSATTAHAVMQKNAEDGGHRRFIMVQLPESCKEDSEAYNAGYANICEIGKERIRRAGEKIQKEHLNVRLDTGFKVFRTDDTTIRWIAAETGQHHVTLEDALLTSGKDLRDFMPGFTDLDVVYEILLRQYDIPLSASIEHLEDIGCRTFRIAEAVIVCLEDTVNDRIIEKITAVEPAPQKIIFRDSAFDDDITRKENAMIRFDALMQKHGSGGKLPYTVEFL